ncbi:hypothetical protein BCR44DRAFT_40875 [Catenaria anguillulae PL171]|uniref:Uncharacterized protein n=1 Tax=Catenaria anguillulae PL171 TaxID=765915 RepID=A0A1Y2HR64_9FUNG|nr:hypothetical protein BCR44DRAFT_40875 [Catenaria anguillulae PL171]
MGYIKRESLSLRIAEPVLRLSLPMSCTPAPAAYSESSIDGKDAMWMTTCLMPTFACFGIGSTAKDVITASLLYAVCWSIAQRRTKATAVEANNAHLSEAEDNRHVLHLRIFQRVVHGVEPSTATAKKAPVATRTLNSSVASVLPGPSQLDLTLLPMTATTTVPDPNPGCHIAMPCQPTQPTLSLCLPPREH